MFFLLQIVSDSAAHHEVYYTISGRGSTEPPVNLFTIDRDTGMLSVHGTVDREEFPEFVVSSKYCNQLPHILSS